jgi:hypothetical protein
MIYRRAFALNILHTGQQVDYRGRRVGKFMYLYSILMVFMQKKLTFLD